MCIGITGVRGSKSGIESGMNAKSADSTRPKMPSCFNQARLSHLETQVPFEGTKFNLNHTRFRKACKIDHIFFHMPRALEKLLCERVRRSFQAAHPDLKSFLPEFLLQTLERCLTMWYQTRRITYERLRGSFYSNARGWMSAPLIPTSHGSFGNCVGTSLQALGQDLCWSSRPNFSCSGTLTDKPEASWCL